MPPGDTESPQWNTPTGSRHNSDSNWPPNHKTILSKVTLELRGGSFQPKLRRTSFFNSRSSHPIRRSLICSRDSALRAVEAEG